MVRSLGKKRMMIDTVLHVDMRLNSTSTTWSVAASADSGNERFIYTQHHVHAHARTLTDVD